MDRMELARKRFEQIMAQIPQNNCELYRREGNSCIVDAGVLSPGGWSVADAAISALLDGRGMVSFSQRMVEQRQIPCADVVWDDPVGAATGSFAIKGNVCGIEEDGVYALGIAFVDDLSKVMAKGNILAARKNSLLGVLFAAAAVLPEAVGSLLEAGVEKDTIQWAWSSCPAVPLSNDAGALLADQKKLHEAWACVSIWLRGEDAALGALAAKSRFEDLRLNNLVSAHTLLSRQGIAD